MRESAKHGKIHPITLLPQGLQCKLLIRFLLIIHLSSIIAYHIQGYGKPGACHKKKIWTRWQSIIRHARTNDGQCRDANSPNRVLWAVDGNNQKQEVHVKCGLAESGQEPNPCETKLADTGLPAELPYRPNCSISDTFNTDTNILFSHRLICISPHQN